jgi:hypothetical protein
MTASAFISTTFVLVLMECTHHVPCSLMPFAETIQVTSLRSLMKILMRMSK